MSTTVLSGFPEQEADHGPGLWQRTYADGASVVTNVRVAGESRTAGSGLINFATVLLGLLGLGLFAVSASAQVAFIYHQKNEHLVSFIEGISLDCALAVFSLLALGLARAGKSAKVERLLVLVCALASAGMNYAAANVLSPRSVVAFVAPPLLLSIVVDRVVAVVRRHVLGDDERSPFAPVGKALLYFIRLAVSPISTAKGARRALLNATPVPAPPLKVRPLPWPSEPVQAKAIPAAPQMPAISGGEDSPPARPKARQAVTKAKVAARKPGSKQAELIRLAIENGLADKPLTEVSKLATALAAKVDLHPATARRVLLAHARSLQGGEAQ